MTRPEDGRDLLLFDGVCALCDGSVRFLLRIDRRRRLRFAPLQGPTARAILVRHEITEKLDSLVLVRDHDTRTESLALRSTAVLLALSAIGGPWRLISWLRLVPRPIRDRVYDFVAKHRYRWFGKFETCRLPAPGEAERFLE